jgi:preprotein translocase subunit SecD
VLLDFTRDGAQVFADVTGRLVKRKLAILVGDEVRSAPVINGRIAADRASNNMGGGNAAHRSTRRRCSSRPSRSARCRRAAG